MTDSPVLRPWHWFIPSDSSGRHQFLTLLVWIEVGGGGIGVVGLLEAWRRGWIGGLAVLGGIPLLLLGLALFARFGWTLIDWSGHHIVMTLLGAGNLTPAESTSAEDAMVMRGRVGEAIALLERRIRETPGSAPLRFKLASLYQQAGDRASAVRALLEIRALPGADRTETQVSNGLIDLFEQMGDRARLTSEYARFADRHRGTRAGAAAKRRLAEIKADRPISPEG